MTEGARAPRRVGVYGGAFDPPHLAHAALARAAIEQLQLDCLRVVPTGHAWHKDRSLSTPDDRLAMARLALGGMAGVVIDDRETRRSGPSYTFDTLTQLQAEEPHAAWFLLIGEDQLAAFCNWHRWREILQLAQLVVARRGDTDAPLLCPWPGSGSVPQAPARVAMLTLPRMAHSSTEIRARVRRGEPVQSLVGDDVARYIAQHHLYQAD